MGSFDSLSNRYIGFTRLFDEIERLQTAQFKAQVPYNIYKHPDGSHVLEMALTGFKKTELDVSHDTHDGTLTVKATSLEEPTPAEEAPTIIYQGLRKRNVAQTFRINDTNLEVSSAQFEDGLLTVTLSPIKKADELVRKVEVK